MNQVPTLVTSVPCNAIAAPPSRASLSKGGKRGPRGGIYDPFPLKFHRMLDQVRDEGQESVVSWLCHGRAFKIHKPKVFAATIMPRFFNQSKYTSFQRQLNLYGFSRCCRGRDAGAYHHPFFLRGKQPLAKNIVRTKIKGNGHKTMRLHEAEPDFHAMAPLPDDAHVVTSNSVSDGSSSTSIISSSALSLEQQQHLERQQQPTMTLPVPSARLNLPGPKSPSPSLVSDDSIFTTNDFPSSVIMKELSRQSSLGGGGLISKNFVNDLNQSIFIHELAMGCTILCNLRKDNKYL